MATKKQTSFENKLSTLESLVDKLEQGDLPLEQALKEFAQGVKIARECQKDLQTAEQNVEILMQKTTDAAPRKHKPESGEEESDD